MCVVCRTVSCNSAYLLYINRENSYDYSKIYVKIDSEPQTHYFLTAAVAQWVRAFASQAEGWVFESQPRQTLVEKRGSNSSTAIGVSVKGPRR